MMNGKLVVNNPFIGEVTKVYQIVEGPIHTDDYDDWDEETEGAGWVVVALVEDLNGAILEEEILFQTFDDAYELVKWFKNQIIPYPVELS
jgi:hypothetical protein